MGEVAEKSDEKRSSRSLVTIDYPILSDSTTPITTTTTITPTTTPVLTNSTTSSLSGCSDNIAFSSGENFPDAKIACYDEELVEDPFSSEDTVISPGTTCIFMTSGNPHYGLFIEIFRN